MHDSGRRLHTFGFQAATKAGTVGVDLETLQPDELNKYIKTGECIKTAANQPRPCLTLHRGMSWLWAYAVVALQSIHP